mgnify:CR=1 FL=1
MVIPTDMVLPFPVLELTSPKKDKIFDGMSIARAVVEYTHSKKIGAKTLFATHYHELTSMEYEFDGIVNYNIAAKKRGDNITFLRKIVRGSTDDSYGIEVAKLAGLPNEVIKRAKEILATVEESAKNIRLTDREERSVEKDESLISFDDCVNEQVIEELKKLKQEFFIYLAPSGKADLDELAQTAQAINPEE